MQSSVAISKLKSCIWAIFGAICGDLVFFEPEYLSEFLCTSNSPFPEGLYVLPWLPQFKNNSLPLDLGDPKKLAEKVPLIEELVSSIDSEDCWVRDTFSISGPGEGSA